MDTALLPDVSPRLPGRVYTKAPSRQEEAFYRELLGQLVARRKELGISQEQLSYNLGVTTMMVNKWEVLIRIPSAFYLMCWCHALGVKVQCVTDHAPR
jgi:ribosome-binding protein aMBF1 (putative translation factor)